MKKIPLILGILGILSGGLVLLVSFGLYATQLAHVSFEEAMLGVIPGAVLLFFSFLLAIVGVIVIKKSRPNT
jgi:hypothetical protein